MTQSSKRALLETTSGALDVAQARGPVRVRMVDLGANQGLQISVDFEKAEVPDRAYYADYTAVVRGRSGPSLFFGKLIPGQVALRTMVEIAFPRDNFVRHLWQGSREFHETVRSFAAQMPVDPIAATEVIETDKVQTFRANTVLMVMLGEESLIDFYYIAPSDIHYIRAGRRADAVLQPVIRICLASAVLFDFLEQCKTEVETDPLLQAILRGEDQK